MKLETLNEVKKLCAELGDLIHLAENKKEQDFKWKSDFESYSLYLATGELKGGRDAAAIRRKSMDLTHTLAKLRQGK